MTKKCLKISVGHLHEILPSIAEHIDLLYEPVINNDLILMPLEDNVLVEELGTLGNVAVTTCTPRKRSLKGLRLRDIVKPYIRGRDLVFIPSSYEIIGDVVLLPPLDDNIIHLYGLLLAKALRTLHPRIKTVYVRMHTEGEYRIRELRLIWGEPKQYTLYKEHGIVFYVLLGKVYVNPSLGTEHARIAELVNDGDRVLDMFAGIGGFSLNIAVRRKALIVAVDINPWAIACLVKSIYMNRRRIKSRIIALNCDARILPLVLKHKSFDHIIMNLPHKSLEFINEALTLLAEGGYLHVYLIARSTKDALSKVNEKLASLGHTCSNPVVIKVLDYAPYKYVFRVTCKVRAS